METGYFASFPILCQIRSSRFLAVGSAASLASIIPSLLRSNSLSVASILFPRAAAAPPAPEPATRVGSAGGWIGAAAAPAAPAPEPAAIRVGSGSRIGTAAAPAAPAPEPAARTGGVWTSGRTKTCAKACCGSRPTGRCARGRIGIPPPKSAATASAATVAAAGIRSGRGILIKSAALAFAAFSLGK